MTQEQTAAKLGVSQPEVANSLRLLNLDDFSLAALEAGLITRSQALTLLSLGGGWQRWILTDLSTEWSFTNRELRDIVEAIKRGDFYIGWRRMVPVEGLYLSRYDVKDPEGCPIECLATGLVLRGSTSLGRARDMGVSTVEATVVYPVELLRDPGPGRLASPEGVRVDVGRSLIVPGLTPEREKRMARFCELLRGKESQYPVIVMVNDPLANADTAK
jgi:hypothetical protein